MKRCFALAALVLAFVATTASAQFHPSDARKYPNLTGPIVLAPPDGLPDVAQCHGILSQGILDLVNAATEDPAEAFERHRREHPHMVMMPASLECASGLWKALKHGRFVSPASVPEGTDALSLRQYPVDSLFDIRALSASVGTNIDPSSGVEGYQGENFISIDPNNPQHIVAHSNTFYRDPSAACQSPTGGSASTYGTMSLFGSTDGGVTWTYKCAPWPAAVTGGVAGADAWFGSDPALSWDSSGRAYACYMLCSQNSTTGDFGASIVVSRSTDNGSTWSYLGTVTTGITSATQGNDKQMMAIDNTTGQAFSHPGRIYVIWDAANSEKIAYSDDGASWTTVNFPSNTGAIGGNVVIGVDGTVYCVWNRYNVETIVFTKSTDGGATWTASNGSLTPWDVGDNLFIDMRSVVVDRSNANRVLVGTNARGVYRSEDGGATLVSVAPALAGKLVSCLVQASDGAFYACVDGSGIAKSTDGGATFAFVNDGLPSLNVGGLTADGSTLYSTSNLGVFTSTNGGGSWTSLDTACLPAGGAGVLTVVGTGATKKLVVATGRGVFAHAL